MGYDINCFHGALGMENSNFLVNCQNVCSSAKALKGPFKTDQFIIDQVSVASKPPWRNWLARSAVNRKVGGSSPPGGVYHFFWEGKMRPWEF